MQELAQSPATHKTPGSVGPAASRRLLEPSALGRPSGAGERRWPGWAAATSPAHCWQPGGSGLESSHGGQRCLPAAGTHGAFVSARASGQRTCSGSCSLPAGKSPQGTRPLPREGCEPPWQPWKPGGGQETAWKHSQVPQRHIGKWRELCTAWGAGTQRFGVKLHPCYPPAVSWPGNTPSWAIAKQRGSKGGR